MSEKIILQKSLGDWQDSIEISGSKKEGIYITIRNSDARQATGYELTPEETQELIEILENPTE